MADTLNKIVGYKGNNQDSINNITEGASPCMICRWLVALKPAVQQFHSVQRRDLAPRFLSPGDPNSLGLDEASERYSKLLKNLEGLENLAGGKIGSPFSNKTRRRFANSPLL